MEILYLITAVIISLTFHEFAHAYTGDALGDETARREGRLSLNPMAHIDPFMTLLLPTMLILIGSPVVFGAAKPVPFNPWALRYGKWGSAMVAVAGPLTNLLIAGFVALWLRLVDVSAASGKFLVAVISVNIAFFIFNMIPFPPLDGSRVLYAIAPYSLKQVMDKIERAGIMGIFIFLFIAYPFISRFIYSIMIWMLEFLVPGASLI